MVLSSLQMSKGGIDPFIRFEESSSLTNPPATVRRDKQGIPSHPSDFELNNIQEAPPLVRSPSYPASGQASTRPTTPNDLERSNPPTPMANGGVDLLQTFSNPPMNKWRMTSSAMMNFANGMNDS